MLLTYAYLNKDNVRKRYQAKMLLNVMAVSAISALTGFVFMYAAFGF